MLNRRKLCLFQALLLDWFVALLCIYFLANMRLQNVVSWENVKAIENKIEALMANQNDFVGLVDESEELDPDYFE